MVLQINQDVLQAIQTHAVNDYPFECCGFLFGHDTGQQRHITGYLMVNNSKEGDQRKRFEVSPKDYMKAERHAAMNDLQLLGIYHSHPDHPAIPSRHDHKQAVPFFSYVILSVRQGQVSKTTSWQLNDQGQFKRETINNKQKYQIDLS